MPLFKFSKPLKQEFLMSILMPDPNSLLNNKISSAAIVKANEAIFATIKVSAKPRGS